MLVEVCANSLESALSAQRAGADRIELCAELGVGGITPSFGLLKAVKEHIDLPVHVLIRPRSGDFTYSKADFETMLTDIALCLELGFNGIVSGALHSDFTLDVERTALLVKASKEAHFTFHRAFDWVENPLIAARTLEEMGVRTILTSGQRATAPEGLPLLLKLQGQAVKMAVMPGGGIHPGNASLFRENGFSALHLSGTKVEKTLAHAPKIGMNAAKFISDDHLARTDEETVRAVVREVK